jgi:VWFA-related protein
MRSGAGWHFVSSSPASAASLRAGIVLVVALSVSAFAYPQRKPKNAKLPAPKQLDRGIAWKRDAATGELAVIRGDLPPGNKTTPSSADATPSIHVVAKMVAVTCAVSTLDGTAVPGLTRSDFRIFDNGVEQPISYFDGAVQPASVALVIDASPSVLRDTDAMKRAASVLVDALAPLDEAAVIDFSAHTYLQLPFSDVRELIRRAVDRVDVHQLLNDTGGSNIYAAVYLAAHDLFPDRKGRKAIVLLTDGQDSGLGLTLDPKSESPQRGVPSDRLTFEDVVQSLVTNDIQVFAVSTENRPKVMTAAWLTAHANSTLATPFARDLAIPPYTLYLAELVRRAGGQIYFLRETPTMADTFREIAREIRAEYTLGFYPTAPAPSSAPDTSSDSGSPARAAATVAPAAAGWHQLRVELPDQAGAHITYRTSYFVPFAN